MKKKNAKQSLKAPLGEIFSSYQGEGIFVGEPQVFIRFSGCNLRCRYCDTPQNQVLAENQKFVSLERIVELVRELASKKRDKDDASLPRTVSLTGGEPLLYPAFLSKLLPELKKLKLKVYLETNGTLPEALEKLSPWIDVVSMDIKPASDCGADYRDEHRRFLKAAKGKVFAKLVLTENTRPDEVRAAVKLVASVSPKIPLVLQPVTPVPKVKGVPPHRLYRWLDMARKELSDVHVLPQMHKIWSVR
ncbi:MAG: 7-carboxy-7-deazaguanine synthase QueE [Minisyncoccota bacterium]